MTKEEILNVIENHGSFGVSYGCNETILESIDELVDMCLIESYASWSGDYENNNGYNYIEKGNPRNVGWVEMGKGFYALVAQQKEAS